MYIDGDLLLTAVALIAAGFFWFIYEAITMGRRRKKRQLSGSEQGEVIWGDRLQDILWAGRNKHKYCMLVTFHRYVLDCNLRQYILIGYAPDCSIRALSGHLNKK